MSMREIDRLKTIQAVADGTLKATTASVRLGLSRRQVDRLVDRYRMDGAAGLVSGKRGQCHHQLSSGLIDLALSIIRERYPDFGPTRWFEGRAPACTLLVFIDDATSRLMHLHFTYSESTFSYPK